MLTIDISNLTPQEAKYVLEGHSFLKKIPSLYYLNAYDWKKCPQYVAKIIENFRLSKLEIADFARRLGLERATIYYFNEGMDHNGIQWNDLSYYINILNNKTPNIGKVIAENSILKTQLGTLLKDKAKTKDQFKPTFPKYLRSSQKEFPNIQSNSETTKPKISNQQETVQKPVSLSHTNQQNSINSQSNTTPRPPSAPKISHSEINLEIYIKSELLNLKNLFPKRIPWLQKPYLVALICKDFLQFDGFFSSFCKKYDISTTTFGYYLRGYKITPGVNFTNAKKWEDLILELKKLNIDIEDLRNKLDKIKIKTITHFIHDDSKNQEFKNPTLNISTPNIENFTTINIESIQNIKTIEVESFENLSYEDKQKIKLNKFEILEYAFDPQGNIIATIRL